VSEAAVEAHPGVGAMTALAFVLIVGRAIGFQCGKQIASYLDWCRGESSGQRRRLGHITKTGELSVALLLVRPPRSRCAADLEMAE